DRLSAADPNYTDDSPFKRKLSEIAVKDKFEFLIDLHGTGSGRPEDVFPGVGTDGEFLRARRSALDELRLSAESNGIYVGSPDVFPASRQMTVTRFAGTTLDVPSLQLEINQSLRQPDVTPERFVILVNFLTDFIRGLS
ncbi:MAG TPA: hypothetical protein VJV40_02930, partial [Thermodesulfobacteriota bacterium]|nr:hypothetical protein [Thermodesulfobacteriota bacterium]